MLISVCLLDDLILGFCYSNVKRETDGFELKSIITLALQANRLILNCSGHLLYLQGKSYERKVSPVLFLVSFYCM